MNDVLSLATEQFCYLTTIGRKSGNPHTVEIWFAMKPDGKTLYILSGGGDKSDWVKNIGSNPETEVRIGQNRLKAQGRFVTNPEEDTLARKLVVARYYGRDYNPSGDWEANSLPVALDLTI